MQAINLTGLRQRTAAFEDIPGFFRWDEGCAAYHLAAAGPGLGCIVEIGSYRGRSTAYLAAGSAAAGRPGVVAVDHFRGSREHQKGQMNEDPDAAAGRSFRAGFEAMMALHGIDAIIAEGDFGEIAKRWARAPRPIRLLLLDADHRFEETKRAYDAWAPSVEPGGIIAFHGYGAQIHDGIKAFVDSIRVGPEIGRVHTLIAFAKEA